MKFVKNVVIVLLVGLSALVLIGVFVPEVDDQTEIKIDRPVVQVYAGMADLKRAPEWVVGLDSVQQTSGFLAMPGSTFKLYYSGLETEAIYNLEVLEMVPLKSVKFKLHNEMFEFNISIKFESEGKATDMHAYVQMKGKGLVSRSLLPLMKSSIMDVGDDNFESLKQLLEQ